MWWDLVRCWRIFSVHLNKILVEDRIIIKSNRFLWCGHWIISHSSICALALVEHRLVCLYFTNQATFCSCKILLIHWWLAVANSQLVHKSLLVRRNRLVWVKPTIRPGDVRVTTSAIRKIVCFLRGDVTEWLFNLVLLAKCPQSRLQVRVMHGSKASIIEGDVAVSALAIDAVRGGRRHDSVPTVPCHVARLCPSKLIVEGVPCMSSYRGVMHCWKKINLF